MGIGKVVSIGLGSFAAGAATLALLSQTPTMGPKRVRPDKPVAVSKEDTPNIPSVRETKFERTGKLIHPVGLPIGLGGGYIEVEKRAPEVYILVGESTEQKKLRVVDSYVVIPPHSSTSDGVGVCYETFDGMRRKWLYYPDGSFKEFDGDDSMHPSNRIANYFFGNPLEQSVENN